MALYRVVIFGLVWHALFISCHATGNHAIGVPDSYATAPRTDPKGLYRLNGRLRPADAPVLAAEPHEPEKSCPPGSEPRGVFCKNSRGTGRQYYISCKPIFKPRQRHTRKQPGEPSRQRFFRLNGDCPEDHLCFPHPRGDERWEKAYNRRGRFAPQREGHFGLPQIDCIDRWQVGDWRKKARSEISAAEGALAAAACIQSTPAVPLAPEGAELSVFKADTTPPANPTISDIVQMEDPAIPDADQVYAWLYGEPALHCSPCD